MNLLCIKLQIFVFICFAEKEAILS